MKITNVILSFILIASSINAQSFSALSTNVESKLKYSLGLEWNEYSDPMIELNYGLTTHRHKNIGPDFRTTGISEIKLGFSTVEDYYKKPILEFRDKFLFVSFISSDLDSKNNNGAIETETWRFGISTRSGYGYSVGEISVLPYVQSGYIWSYLSNKSSKNLSQLDLKIIDRYEERFNFGNQDEAGIRIKLSKLLSFNFGYETAIIYPRHLFWKWSVSELTKYVVSGGLTFFTNEIIESTPEAGPVVNFILQNALSYGFYALRRNDMNWPFSTETPLTHESFKIGLSLSF